MKRITPLKMKSMNMDEYAEKRKKSMAKTAPRQLPVTEIRAVMMHDPESDLHHLVRAAEVQSDKNRHKMALDVARKKMNDMQRVMKTPKE